MRRRRGSSVCSIPGCPSLATNHGRCPTHGGNHTGWSPGRDRAAQQRFRQAVLARDGYQCVDCGATNDLRACHLQPVGAGGGYHPDNGVTRCGQCDRATDQHAR
jgi:5-methylcytosine-specific restriction endonuclease McrA